MGSEKGLVVKAGPFLFPQGSGDRLCVEILFQALLPKPVVALATSVQRSETWLNG